MEPFESLYGRPCRTPTCWTKAKERPLAKLEIMEETETKIKDIREHTRFAQLRQQQYAYKRRTLLEFKVNDMVMLKVSPWIGMIRFNKQGKLSPRYIGPLQIIQGVEKVPYQLDLLQELQHIHIVFYIFYLRKTLFNKVQMMEIEVDEKLRYPEQLEKILDNKIKKLRNKEIVLVKVQWRHHRGSDVTWEPEAEFIEKYPYLFN